MSREQDRRGDRGGVKLRAADFVFKGVRTSMVNALRRIILSEVPYIATYRNEARDASSRGGFVVTHNTGRLHNDMLVDRLALVPIHLTRSEVDQFIPGSVTVRLQAKNDGASRRDITSQDLDVSLFGKPHPNAKACYVPHPATDHFPLITKLYPGEHIDVTMTLEKDVARKHAAFAVASLVAMQPHLDDDEYRAQRARIEADTTLDDDAKAQALNYCDFITRKQLISRSEDGEPTGYSLTVETECGLTPHEIVSSAMDVLLHKFSSSALSYEVSTDADARSVFFTLSEQGHTFGSVLQDLCMRDREQLAIESVGYYETHPLEDRIVVRVVLSPEEFKRVDSEQLISKMRAHCVRELERFRMDSEI